jgi:Fuc2NAc and GlcNAc transferase
VREEFLVLFGFLIAFALSFLITRKFIALAPRFGLLDQPNHRSSHVMPTARGAGLVFIVVINLGFAVFQNRIGTDLWILLACSDVVAIVGLLDDLRGLSPAIRLLFHLLASALFVGSLGLADVSLQSAIVVGLAITAFINIFNFMDGIDGLAATQAVVALFGVALMTNLQTPILIWIVGSLVGFLFFNWSPAKAFMGDVGSGFLGFFLAGLAAILHHKGTLPVVVGANLVVGFLIDALVTLVVRATSGQTIYQAHRDHAYQHMVRKGMTHSKVTTIYMILTLGVCLPLAYLGLSKPEFALGCLFASSTIFLVLCFKFRAGKRLAD